MAPQRGQPGAMARMAQRKVQKIRSRPARRTQSGSGAAPPQVEHRPPWLCNTVPSSRAAPAAVQKLRTSRSIGYPSLPVPLSKQRAHQLATAAAWILALTAFIGVVNGVRASRIDIRNSSSAPVTDLVVRLGERELKLGELGPGQRASLRACPEQGAVAQASWKSGGRDHQTRVGYLECGVFCLELVLAPHGALGQSTSCE